MICVEYRDPETCSTLFVEHDERLLFWPFRVRGHVGTGDELVERSWRGATLRDAVDKAADASCLAVPYESAAAVVADVERRLARLQR